MEQRKLTSHPMQVIIRQLYIFSFPCFLKASMLFWSIIKEQRCSLLSKEQISTTFDVVKHIINKDSKNNLHWDCAVSVWYQPSRLSRASSEMNDPTYMHKFDFYYQNKSSISNLPYIHTEQLAPYHVLRAIA